ncbi:MAG: amino acid racemase [Candidatus Levybacteria bacterium]|nr:amino acid racemase [Candidatus Levybacteria bacterium]
MKGQAIGILGGMGPEASVYLYRLLIEKAISDFGAKNNDDFPEIILHSIPVPDFISSDARKAEALQMLEERVRFLNNTNISCLAIACNTAHLLLPQLKNVSTVPFISMIDEAISVVEKDGMQTVGILGTPSTIRSGLYQHALIEKGIATVEPEEKMPPVLERVIRNVIKGDILRSDADALVTIANELKKKGAEGIILGCTELPLVFPNKYSLPVYNSITILALAFS